MNRTINKIRKVNLVNAVYKSLEKVWKKFNYFKISLVKFFQGS